ncbi:MAG TPA: DNA mismatch repair protein MutS, partial [Spirochaetia bacterium]|nr:DNA mismatch repair protein MutS [Spirochaetia bacterium]
MTEETYDIYRSRKIKFEKAVNNFKKKDDLLVLWRAIVFTPGAGLLIYSFYSERALFILLTMPFALVFLLLVIQHAKAKTKIKYFQSLVLVNSNCLLRLSGKWASFANSGQQFVDPSHQYSSDLNIFGRGSLFQYINATTTFMGEQSLSNLLNERTALKEIKLRQKAIEDLAGRLDWRQHLQVTGLDTGMQNRNPEGLVAWGESRRTLINNKYLPLLWFLPVITLAFMILAYFRLIPPFAWIYPLSTQMLTVWYTEKLVRPTVDKTGKAVSDLERFSLLLRCIEGQDFEADLLVKMKDKLYLDGKPASWQIKTLSRIMDRFSLRHSPLLHIVVNVLTFWDLATLVKLEKWRNRSGILLRKWLDVIGNFEALSSFAGLAYDNPGWVYPEIVDCPPLMETRHIGHPLIIKDLRICNDISFSVIGATCIITGSNMSGKSTFLRTVGLNLVLAYCGAPVCALSMRCS